MNHKFKLIKIIPFIATFLFIFVMAFLFLKFAGNTKDGNIERNKSKNQTKTQVQSNNDDNSKLSSLDQNKLSDDKSEEINEASIEQDTFPDEVKEEINEEMLYTYSTGGSVNTGVIFRNPITKKTDTLEFKVMLDTHSKDLSQYKNFEEFVELKVDEDLTITKGFIWEAENDDGHHVSGILSIENNHNGEFILDENTESINLIIKNVAEVEEREHIYEGNSLKY